MSRIHWILFPALLLAWSGAGAPASWSQPESQAQAPDTATAPTSSLPPQQVTAEQLGDSMFARHRYQEAIEQYSKAPVSAAIWNKMGVAYQMLFNAKDAARCYRESLKLEPRDAQVLNNLGTLYASLKDYGQAGRMYHKSLKIEPHSAVTLKNLGTDLMAEHKYAKGYEAYKQAIAVDPQIFSEHGGPLVEDASNAQQRGAMNYYMALGCASAGHTECALEYLRRALDEGFVTPKKIASDAEFASLRGNPAFQQLIAGKSSQ